MAFQFSASASPVTLRWGIAHDLYYHRKIANQFKEEIEKKTNKRIQIKVETFNSNKVIKSAHEFVEKNKYEICQDIIGNFEHIAPESKVWEMPFLFRDFAHAEKYIVSANAEKVLEKINEKDPTLHAVAYSFSGGPLVIYSPEKLNSMRDLKGKEFSIGVNFGFDAQLKKELGVTTKREDGKKLLKLAKSLARRWMAYLPNMKIR